ncbi:hypothetical protein LTS18_009517, partial [Coniosporium uncinatum]
MADKLRSRISREHVWLGYNFSSESWEIKIFGRCGAFHDGRHHRQGDKVKLHHKSRIQVGATAFDFVLPVDDEDIYESDYDERSDSYDRDESTGSQPVSFKFEAADGGSIHESDIEDDENYDYEETRPPQPYEYNYDDDDDDENENDEAEEDEEESGDEEEAEEMAKTKRGRGQKVILKAKKPAKKPSPPPTKLELNLKRVKSDEKPVKPETARDKKASKALPKTQPTANKKTQPAPAKAPKKVPAKTPAPAPQESPAPEAEKPAKREETSPSGVTAVDGDKEVAVNGIDFNDPSLPIGYQHKKRKGPGRPPKNGIMSKREFKEIQKEAKLKDKAEQMGMTLEELLATMNRSQPRAPSNDASKPEKAKPANKDGVGEDETPVADDEDPGGDAEQKKIAKAPRVARTPSPPMYEKDYTEEQLTRPQLNYAQMLHIVIEEKNGPMNLQNAYSAIEHKWPFFRFRVKGDGWKSSVRHNLTGHTAFRKVARDGKGHTWEIVPGVSVDKEAKRKKSPSPVRAPPPYQQQHLANPYQRPSYPPPAYPPHYPGQPPPHGQRPPPANMRPPSLNGGPPPPGNGTYVSPWASQPSSSQGPAPNHYGGYSGAYHNPSNYRPP